MKKSIDSIFVVFLALFGLSKIAEAGIVFDLEDPRFSTSFKDAVDTAGDVLSKDKVGSMGAPVQACQEMPKPKVITVKKGKEEVPPVVSPPQSPSIDADKGNVVVDTFQMIEESKFVCESKDKVSLRSADGKSIKSVCPEFLNNLSLYGLGKLADGKVVQFSKTVKVEKTVNGVKSFIWEKRFALANSKCVYGQTAAGVCLEPYRSLIVSAQLGLAVGDIVYLEDFKDIVIPPGVKHGGYFIVSALKKSDESLKPEINVFLGTDSHEDNALFQVGSAYKSSGFKLTALKGAERTQAAQFINNARKEIAALWAKKKTETPKPVVASDPANEEELVSLEASKLNQGGWTDVYTQAILSSINGESSLLSLATDEIVQMCPRFTKMQPHEKKLFWAHFLRALAKPESGFNPHVGMREDGDTHKKGDGALRKMSGGYVPSTSNGLLQLSYQDALYHGCDFDYQNEWEMAKIVSQARYDSGSRQSLTLDQLVERGHLDQKYLEAAKSLSIYDPVKNLQCAVKILEKQVGPIANRKLVDTTSKYYWSVLAPNRNPKGYEKFTEELLSSTELCSLAYQAPLAATSPAPAPSPANPAPQPLPPQGLTEGVFKLSLSQEEKKQLAKKMTDNNHSQVSPAKVDELTNRLNRSASTLVNFHQHPSYDGARVEDGSDLTLRMSHLLNDLAKSPQGRYALIDYLEFKGDGLSSNERVFDTKGNKTTQGFGLYQVLASAAKEYDGTRDPVSLFSSHASEVLHQRIKTNDSTPSDNKGLSKYKKEWDQRLASYGTITPVALATKPQPPKVSPQPEEKEEDVLPAIPVTPAVAISSDQPFEGEARLVLEGNFPEVDCEGWGLKANNFCYPEPGKIVLSPSHGVEDDSRRNSIDDGHGGNFFHEGHMNVSTSLVIKSAIDKCLSRPNSAGEIVPQVKLARWPGEVSFGQQEFNKNIGQIVMDSHKGGRPGYVNQYLLGDGKAMDTEVADRSLLICVDYNASKTMDKDRDHSFAFPPRTSSGKDSVAISDSVSAHMIDGLYSYLESLGSNSPVASNQVYKDNSYMNAASFSKGLTMFTDVGTASTKHITVEGFFMNGGIGRHVASKIKTDDPANYYEFNFRKKIYNSKLKDYVLSEEPVKPTYRMTTEHLLVARGVVQGIMNNSEYQCK